MPSGKASTDHRAPAAIARLVLAVLPVVVVVGWLVGATPAHAATPTIDVSDAVPNPVTEGNTGTTVNVTFTVTLAESPGPAVKVNFATMLGSATANVDYVFQDSSVTFAAGATGAGLIKTITVVVNGDNAPEPNETFFVQLYNPTGGGVLGDRWGQATINNDDGAPPTISVSDATPSPVVEGNSGTTPASFNVVLSASPSAPVTYKWASNPGTAAAGSDYVVATGTGTFAAGTGTLTQTVVVQVNGDTTPEGNETFLVQIYDVGGASVTDAYGGATIQNDDASVPVISIADVTKAEGTTAQVPVTLSFSPPGPVTVKFRTMQDTYFNTTATAGSDYTAQVSTLSWSTGDPMLTKTIDIPLAADGSSEASERFYVQIYDPVGGNLAAIRYGKVTISAPPVATADSFTAVGNTKLVVEAADPAEPRKFQATGDLIENDTDPESDTLTVTGPGTTTNGGTLTLNPNGSFVYLPAVGFTGADGFTYVLSDGQGNTVNGTVSITVANRVWYVNNAGGAGDGRSNSPFNSLASVSSGGDPDGTGDYIFLFQGGGTYTGGLVLETSQRLIGQPEGLVVGPDTLFAAGGTNPVITNGAGNGIQLANDTVIRRVNVTGTSGAGMQGNTVTNVDIGPNLTVTNSAGAGISFFNAASGTITVGANITHSSASGRSFFVANRSGGTVTMSGTINDTAGGVQFDLNTGATINLTGALTLSGATETFKATGGGTVTATNSANTLNNTGSGPALNVTSTNIGAAGLTFQSINSNGGANGIVLSATGSSGGLTVTGTGGAGSGGTIQSKSGAGISLTNVGGAVSLTNMATTSVASADVLASGGGGDLTYAGTINNAAGGNRSVDILSKTGGTVLFSGAITDNGTGISLASNGGTTMSFTGGLTMSTGANPAFAATGGGTVNITGSTNTITTTTGTALNVTSTTIGASGITLRSINSNGGTNGIVLSSTGSSGGLTVTGTGAADSGGTIQNKSGDAISLTSTSNVSLTRVRIINNLGNGIRGAGVTNFTLDNSTIDNNADDPATDEAGLHFTNLAGTATISNTTVANSPEDNARILNSSGTLTQLNVTDSTFRDTDTISPGNNGLLIQADGGSITADVLGCTFLRNRANGLQVITNGTGSMDVEIDDSGATQSTFDDNNIGINIAHNSSGSFNFDVRDVAIDGRNVPAGSGGSASPININLAGSATTTMSGNVTGNTLTNSDSTTGPGIRMVGNGTATMTVLVDSNNISQVANRGIEVIARDGSNRINATISNNTVTLANGFAADAIRADAGAVSTDTTTICADIRGNTATTIATQFGVRVRQRFAGTSYILEDYAGAPTDDAAVQTFLSTNNNAATTSADHAGAGFTSISECPMPT